MPALSSRRLVHRHDHNYPPYQRLARLIIRGRDQAKAGAFAESLAGVFNTVITELASGQPTGRRGLLEMRLLGPAEAPVFRLKGYYRFHFQLQSRSPAMLHKVLRAVLPALPPRSGVEFTLDVDPFNML